MPVATKKRQKSEKKSLRTWSQTESTFISSDVPDSTMY